MFYLLLVFTFNLIYEFTSDTIFD